MLLARATFDILNQVQLLLEQIEPEEYALPLPMFNQSSIGKHVRHIVEFYICLLDGLKEGVIDYDSRKRDLLLETNLQYVKETIDKIVADIINRQADQAIRLRIFPSLDAEWIDVDTTYFRELGYNIEHVIHHIALIKIAVNEYFSNINLPENFGVAYATIKYQQAVCAP